MKDFYKFLNERANMKLDDLIHEITNGTIITKEELLDTGEIISLTYKMYSVLELLIIYELDSDLIKTAVDMGADINNKIDKNAPGVITHLNKYVSIANMTPLMLASIKGITFTNIKILIDAGANWNAIDLNGNTFVYYLNDDKWLEKNYPKKYKNFLVWNKTNEFNI